MHTYTHTHTVRREVGVIQAHERVAQTLRAIDIHALSPENIFHSAKQCQAVTERAIAQLEFYKWVARFRLNVHVFVYIYIHIHAD